MTDITADVNSNERGNDRPVVTEIRVKRSGYFWHGVITAIIIIAAGYFGVRFMMRSLYSRNMGLGVVQSAIENCGEMTTLRAYFEAIADSDEKGIFMTWRKFAIIFRGTVDCGFDMRKARVELFEAEKRVEVNLPHCQIQRVWINLESGDKGGIKVYDQQGGWFASPLTLEEQNEIVSKSLKSIRERAYDEWDIILRAEENAAKLYKNFLAPFNYNVSVIFTDDESKLGVPDNMRADTMKGGGALIVHTAQ